MLRTARVASFTIAFGSLAVACDAAQFPHASFVSYDDKLDTFSSVTPSAPGVIADLVASDDNPQLISFLAAPPGLSVTWQDGQIGATCGPNTPLTTDGVFNPANFTNCAQTYHLSSGAGENRFALMLDFTDEWPVSAAFVNGWGGQYQDIHQPSYGDGYPGLLFMGCPNNDSSNVTFPVAFPKMHLPVDLTGQVREARLQLAVFENDVFRSLGRVIVRPPPGLIVVPIHLHLWKRGENLSQQRAIASEKARIYDDPGALAGDWWGDNKASLTRPFRTPLGVADESVFRVANVQLRVVSVQFHDRAGIADPDGKVRAHCDRCGQRDCREFMQTPLGAAIASWSSPDLLSRMRAPQGIHVVEVDDGAYGDKFYTPQGPFVGSGYGCAPEPGNGVPAIAIYNFSSEFVGDPLHEISHALEMEEKPIQDAINLRKGWTEGQIPIIREAAQAVVDLVP